MSKLKIVIAADGEALYINPGLVAGIMAGKAAGDLPIGSFSLLYIAGSAEGVLTRGAPGDVARALGLDIG